MPRLNSRKRKSKKKRSRKRNQSGSGIFKVFHNKIYKKPIPLSSMNKKKLKKLVTETLKEGQIIHGNKVPFKNAEDYIQHFIYKFENYLNEIINKNRLRIGKKKLKRKIKIDLDVNKIDTWMMVEGLASFLVTYGLISNVVKKKDPTSVAFATSITPITGLMTYYWIEGIYKNLFGLEQHIPKYLADAWNNDDLHPASTNKITQKFVRKTIIELTKKSRKNLKKNMKKLESKSK